MRRVLFLLLLAAAPVSAAFAAPLTLGLHGGSSIPNLRDNGGNELSRGWSSRVAPFFGLSADVELSPVWSVRTELNWAPQGGKRNGMQAIALTPGGWTYANITNESRINYVEVPVLASRHFGGPSRLTLSVGPYVGILVSAKQLTGGNSAVFFDPAGTVAIQPPMSFDATTDIKSSVHSFNWGFQAGVGASRPLGKGELTLDVRGGLGLTNIQKYVADGKNATGALVVTVGYALPVGGAH